MKALLRADAGIGMGTGHVMRCLTLAEELGARGHEVVLRGSLGGVGWLDERVRGAGVTHETCEAGVLDVEAVAGRADVVVVDSYTIDAADVRGLTERMPVLALIDGDDRGIRATAYVDANLGAEETPYPPHVARRLSAGSRYALVRRELRALRRPPTAALPASPTVLCLMGGSDPLGLMPRAAAALAALPAEVRLVFVTAPAWVGAVQEAVGARAGSTVGAQTPRLAELVAEADLVVSAAGTTAWDLCTIGVPAVFLAVVGNQRPGLRAIVDAGLAPGIDASEDPTAIDGVGVVVEELLADAGRRIGYAKRCLQAFDGRGAERVADILEELARG